MTTVTRVDNTQSHAVCQSILSNGYWVSTVVLDNSLVSMIDGIVGGILVDQGRADLSTPGTFETMVFACDEDGEVTSWRELDFARYSTREDAAKGHEEIVERWMEK
jgi:hypothetical protein